MNLSALAPSLAPALALDAFARAFDQSTRAIRLRFAGRLSGVFDGVLIPQRVDTTEALHGGITAHLTVLATRADLPLAQLVGLSVEVQFVTDRGGMRRLCAVTTEVRQGQSDGAITVLQLTCRDMFAVMTQRRGNRVFLGKSALDVARIVLDGWRSQSPAIAHAFDYLLLDIDEAAYPQRALTFQAHQSDAEFLRSVLKRNGISWFFRPGADGEGHTPAQQLVLFDNARHLPQNAAGPIRYHRCAGTEARDAIGLLAPTRTLVSGSVTRASWDHESARVDVTKESSTIDQGATANELAAALADARIELPHAGDSWADHQRLTGLAMRRHESESHCLHGVGSVRDQAVGEWNRIYGHAMLDSQPAQDREYLTVSLQTWAENSLPKALNERAQGLLAASESGVAGWVALAEADRRTAQGAGTFGAEPDRLATTRFTNRFIALRRDVPVVPPWNPETDLPRMPFMTATVAGMAGESVWCDELGRVKVSLHGLEPADHQHAGGAGTDGDAGDSAWVQVNFLWAGDGFGIFFPLRAGMEVSLGFEQGDPSRPMIVGSRYNGANATPRFDHLGSLPKNRALSGIVTRELNGQRQQQLRFNDTHGNISAQFASDHAATQLNLGSLATPMSEGQTEPRGEGAELRSDAAVAIRGGQGVLVTSSGRTGAQGHQLDRAELVGLAQTLQAIAEQLGELATTHQTSGTDPSRLRQLVKHLTDWEHGAGTAPEGGAAGRGGAPIVAVSAAAGASIVSQDNLVLGAQTHLDAVSAGHTQLTAGQQIRQRAGQGVSTFAHTGGIETIAGAGLVDIQAHQGNIHLTASDTIVLTAGTKIVIQAPEVHIVGQGTQTQWAGGSIVEQASGPFVVKAASFAQTSGGGGVPAGVKLPMSQLQTDEKYVLRLRGAGTPLADRRYRIELADGGVLQGRSDAYGATQLAQSDAMKIVTLTVFEDRA